MECVIKSHNNFCTDIAEPFVPFESISKKINDWIIHVRAFSLTRNVWIKDHMPFSEIVTILKKEGFLIENLKIMYYSMIRDAATLLAHKIVFSEEAKTTEIKKKALSYDIRLVTNSKDDLEKTKRKHMEDLKRQRRGLRDGGPMPLRQDNRNQIDQNKIFY